MPAAPHEVVTALRKSLPGGRLHRMPRHPHRRDILLAVLSLDLVRRRAYSEPEVNEHLQGALADVHARVDHVTCRRYLVDLGFLRRDRAGARYFLNYPRIEGVLSAEAMTRAPELIAQAIRENRRRPRHRPG